METSDNRESFSAFPSWVLQAKALLFRSLANNEFIHPIAHSFQPITPPRERVFYPLAGSKGFYDAL